MEPGQAVVLRLVRLEERLGHRGVDVRGHDRGNEPVPGGRVPGDLHEVRVVGGVAADDGHGPLHLLHLAQQQARFGVVAVNRMASGLTPFILVRMAE